ncbi:hypothetical protein H7X65_02220 [Candidatus Parcubacteria bacterium]|nr:hypothetical protein [Candidatus Parcubacteria bacterium]
MNPELSYPVEDSRSPWERKTSRLTSSMWRWLLSAIILFILGSGAFTFIARELNEPKHELDATIGKIAVVVVIISVVSAVTCISKALGAWSKKQKLI